MIQPSKFSFIATAIAAVAMCFCGCSSTQKQIGPKRAANWAYAPNTVAVHQLSRIRTNPDPSKATIVVHVEFLDGDGFACRGVGELFVEIVSASGKTTDTKAFDLRDAATNRELFDAVTRTYRIELDTVSNVDFVKTRAKFDARDGEILRSGQKTLRNHSVQD